MYSAGCQKLTNYLANTKQSRYDGINRLIEEKDALGNVVQQLEYNDANAQLHSYDALQNKITYLYDRNMRNIGTTDAEGNTTSSTYDTRGNLRTKTDGNGNTTTYHYDSTNRLIKVTDALGQSTSYTYDNNDNLISQTDGNGNVSTFQYNVANKMIARIDPEGRGNSGKTETYTYYSNGLMATKKNRNGVITNYTYDIFGRLLSEDAGGEVQSYTYDANGNMLTMTDATGTTTRTYDRLNRNISKAVPEIGLSTYEYDLTTSEEGVYQERTTDPKGNVTLKEYDQVGRLSKVTVDDKTTVYKYSLNGRRTSVTYPDGTKETYTYDKVNNVLTLKNTKKDSSLISSYEYTYDSNGNVLTKKEEKGITSYIYDELNRLSSVTEPGGKTTSYDYDGAGNRVKETVTLTQNDTIAQAYTNYTYNSQNRLMKTVSNSGSETRYLYDSNGNMVSKSTLSSKTKAGDSETTTELPSYNIVVNKGSGTGTEDITLFFYDKFNRQVRVKTAEASTTYRYNAQGYRSEKNTEGKIIRYLYEVDKVVLETDGSNNQIAYQAYGTNLLYRSVAEEAGVEDESYYYLYNAHGDVTGLVDAEGKLAATYDYDAFGTIIAETGAANNTVKYAGYQYDEETDLYYLNARYYDSVTARFLSEDTYRGQANDPLSMNLYTYCSNNPIMYTDPSGHKAENINISQKISNILRKATRKIKNHKLVLQEDNEKPSDERQIVDTALIELFKKTSNEILNNTKTQSLCYTAKDGKIYHGDWEYQEYWEKKKEKQSKQQIKKSNLVTAEQLEAFGWYDTSDEYVKKLNETLIIYNITDKESICLFMATMAAESDWGKKSLEEGSEKYFNDHGYTGNTRGAGYIQITGKDTHKEFLKSIPEDSYSGKDTATYIANNYALEASAWYWSNMKKTGEGNLNAYVSKNGGSLEIFLITQYFVNGTPSKIDSDLGSIRKGDSYTINTDRKGNSVSLSVNGNTYRLPDGWDRRVDAYNKATEVFGI